MSVDEYEQKVAEARGTTRAAALAGMNALNKMINPKAVEAVEKQKDLRAGYYNDEQTKGEGDGPDPTDEELKPKGEEETKDEEGDDA